MTGRNLVFTLYRSKTDRFGTPVSLPWGGWVDRHLSRHAVRGSPEDTSDRDALEQAKDGPAIVLGEISQGKPRAAANVRAVHALALDIEGKHDDEVFEALARINAFEWIAYTTHKHAARCAGGGTRLRVILPLIEPIGPSDHPAAWSGINRLVGGINDPATRDVGRLHFLPSTYDPTTAWAHPNRGHWLSTDDLPDDPHDVAPPDAKIQADRLRGALRRAPRDLEIKEAARRLLEGAALAEPGTRHTTIRDLTWWIASRFDDLGDEALGLTFNRSLEAMRAVDPSAPGLAEVVEGYRGAVEKQTEARGRERARQDERAADRQQGGDGPYDDEDLARIAVSQGCEPDELSDRWIVQRDKIGTWFLDGSGRYRGPYTGDDAPVQAMRILRRAPVRLLDSTKSGYRRRALIDVVSESGGVAVRIVPSLVHQLNTFDATSGTMYEACCPLRPLEPAYDEAIDGWLRVFAGPHYGKLVDWLACVPDLTKIMCALYVDGSPGCLAGDTIIGINRAGKSFPIRLDRLVTMFNGGKIERSASKRCPAYKTGSRWRQDIPTTIRFRDADGYLRLTRLVAAVWSGLKETFTLVISDGRSIRATADHRFLTDNGWKRLSAIEVGDFISVTSSDRKQPSRKPKRSYKEVYDLRAHPFAGRKGKRKHYSRPEHVLVMEAHSNSLSYSEFLSRVRLGDVDDLQFIDPKIWHVHHVNEDPLDNRIKNLEMLPVREHLRKHGKAGGWKHVAYRTEFVDVVAIDSNGTEETYDLEVEDDEHNFVANGMIVHNSGKTLLAEGLARLWTEGSPGKLEEVVDQFNEELTRCPLLLADEEIPVRRSRQTTTTVLRSMISRSTHSLVRKYKAPGELLGAIRLIIAGNNEFLLDTRGVSSTHDLEAVAQRFLYLNVPREAVERLEAVPRAEREAWAGGKIASHALWLAQNHEVEQPGRRFWVEGDVSQMHRLLMTGSRWNSLICEWLVRYLMNPNPIDSKADGLVRRGDGELLINDQALIDGWEQYLKTRDEPETRMVGAALRALSKTATRRQLRYRGQRIRYRVVDIDHLLAWSDHHNIGDRETMLQALGESSVREPGEDQTTTDELDTVPSVNEEGTPF